MAARAVKTLPTVHPRRRSGRIASRKYSRISLSSQSSIVKENTPLEVKNKHNKKPRNAPQNASRAATSCTHCARAHAKCERRKKTNSKCDRCASRGLTCLERVPRRIGRRYMHQMKNAFVSKEELKRLEKRRHRKRKKKIRNTDKQPELAKKKAKIIKL